MAATDDLNGPADPTSEVATHIRRRVGGRLAGLRVVIEAGGLVLDGVADCYHVRQVAVAAARTATGLPVRADRIRVVRAGEPIPRLG